jgi:tetratricopeptide (TPR) repeat protein
MTNPPNTRQIIDQAIALRDALGSAQAGGDLNRIADLARAVTRAPMSVPDGVIQLAAAVLAACGAHGEAIEALKAACQTAPGLSQIALQIAASHHAIGQSADALTWARRAIDDFPLDEAAYRLAYTLELQVGEAARAIDCMDALTRIGHPMTLDPVEHGELLWRCNRSAEAVAAFQEAYDQGRREPRFLKAFLSLLTGEQRCAEVLAIARDLTPDEARACRRSLPMLTGHAKLALASRPGEEVRLAHTREAGGRWLTPAALLDELRAVIVAARPFSLIRLGDGEARFLIYMLAELRPGLEPVEAAAIGDVIWENWFGQPITSVASLQLSETLAQLRSAVVNADVLGVTDASRMAGDTGHFGYMAAQEVWLRALPLPAETRFTDAFAHHHLQKLSPYLGDLLQGLDFLGVVSPHPELAAHLQQRFNISRAVSHNLAGEGRLPTHRAARDVEPTYPQAHNRILDELRPPRRGAVYLVAAGLLGKIHCDRIRQLGGIALDVGSIVDAWMGYNTRPGQMDDVQRLV